MNNNIKKLYDGSVGNVALEPKKANQLLFKTQIKPRNASYREKNLVDDGEKEGIILLMAKGLPLHYFATNLATICDGIVNFVRAAEFVFGHPCDI